MTVKQIKFYKFQYDSLGFREIPVEEFKPQVEHVILTCLLLNKILL